MNKRQTCTALAGVLAVLLMPGLLHAQKNLVRVGSRVSRFLASYEQKTAPVLFNRLEQNLARSVEEATVKATPAGYKIPSYITLPDLSSRRDARQFMNFMDMIDLEGATPNDLGWRAVMDEDLRWIAFSLENGADPISILRHSISHDEYKWGSKKDDLPPNALTNILIRDFGLNPNATLPNGDPLLFKLAEAHTLPEWFLSREDVNINVQRKQIPVIFSMQPSSLPFNAQFGFKSLIAHTDPWMKDPAGMTLVHQCAAYFSLEKDMPEGFTIPKELLNATDDNHNTLLHMAATTDNMENYRYLINLGADPTFPNRWGHTPVGILAEHALRNSGLSTQSSSLIDDAVRHPRTPLRSY